MSTHTEIKQQLHFLGNPERAEHSKRFFKTGKGEYAEGDKFFGCTVPEIRIIAKENKDAPLAEIIRLLNDDIHECRLCALLILVDQYKKATEEKRADLIDCYLAHTHRVNNWDLVDLSAPKLLGEWLKDKNRTILYRLATDSLLWNQRIAIVATYTFIRNNDFTDTLALCEHFLTHKHDLIHKACGWMLREMGKRDELALTDFLDKHAHNMPRTMLRYSIEKFSPEKRSYYMLRS